MSRLRRLAPRFSLRTLAVFLLLATSGTGLWWHWEAWYVIRPFRLRGDDTGMSEWAECISHDGTKVVISDPGPDVQVSTPGGGTADMSIRGHRVHDIATGAKTFELFSDSFAFLLPDGRRILLLGASDRFRVYDMVERRCVASHRGKGQSWCAWGLSPCGNYFVVHSADERIEVRDLRTARTVSSLAIPKGDEVGSPRISPDGSRCVFEYDRALRSFPMLAKVADLEIEGDIQYAAFSPDGKMVAVCTFTGNASLHDARTGKRLPLSFGVRGKETAFSFSPDGSRVLTTFDGGLQVWDSTSLKKLAERDLEGKGVGRRPEYLGDARRIYVHTCTYPGNDRPGPCAAEIWDGETLRTLMSIPATFDHSSWPMASSDGRTLGIHEPGHILNIYRRRRPEWWWGVFYLWEFWLTVVLAGLFVWSVVRDRRSLRLKDEPTE